MGHRHGEGIVELGHEQHGTTRLILLHLQSN